MQKQTNAQINYELEYTVKNLAYNKIEPFARCLMIAYLETILR